MKRPFIQTPPHPVDPFTTVWKSSGARSKNAASPPVYHIDPLCPMLIQTKRLIMRTRLGAMIAGGRHPCKVCGHKLTTEAEQLLVDMGRRRAIAILQGKVA